MPITLILLVFHTLQKSVFKHLNISVFFFDHKELQRGSRILFNIIGLIRRLNVILFLGCALIPVRKANLRLNVIVLLFVLDLFDLVDKRLDVLLQVRSPSKP